MPELPEVQTTATILNSLVAQKTIFNVWTDYNSPYYYGKNNIKSPEYFLYFKKNIQHQKILRVYRKAKNVLIELENGVTIVVHMKMTGHLLYGTYSHDLKNDTWSTKENGPLQDPFNRFIHLVFSLTNDKHIAFSDVRKFATVQLLKDKEAFDLHFKKFGEEPLQNSFNWKVLKKRLTQKPNQRIKTALMDQTLIVGIGNIYSDEILWSSKINPERTVMNISDTEFKTLCVQIKKLLSKGISFGGDSMSDYRNPHGEAGKFQGEHNVYQRTNQKCKRTNCNGIIERKIIGARSAHYCPVCQK